MKFHWKPTAGLGLTSFARFIGSQRKINWHTKQYPPSLSRCLSSRRHQSSSANSSALPKRRAVNLDEIPASQLNPQRDYKALVNRILGISTPASTSTITSAGASISYSSTPPPPPPSFPPASSSTYSLNLSADPIAFLDAVDAKALNPTSSPRKEDAFDINVWRKGRGAGKKSSFKRSLMSLKELEDVNEMRIEDSECPGKETNSLIAEEVSKQFVDLKSHLSEQTIPLKTKRKTSVMSLQMVELLENDSTTAFHEQSSVIAPVSLPLVKPAAIAVQGHQSMSEKNRRTMSQKTMEDSTKQPSFEIHDTAPVNTGPTSAQKVFDIDPAGTTAPRKNRQLISLQAMENLFQGLNEHEIFPYTSGNKPAEKLTSAVENISYMEAKDAVRQEVPSMITDPENNKTEETKRRHKLLSINQLERMMDDVEVKLGNEVSLTNNTYTFTYSSAVTPEQIDLIIKSITSEMISQQPQHQQELQQQKEPQQQQQQLQQPQQQSHLDLLLKTINSTDVTKTQINETTELESILRDAPKDEELVITLSKDITDQQSEQNLMTGQSSSQEAEETTADVGTEKDRIVNHIALKCDYVEHEVLSEPLKKAKPTMLDTGDTPCTLRETSHDINQIPPVDVAYQEPVGAEIVTVVEIYYNERENEAVDAKSLLNAESDFKEETNDAIIVAAHELSPELIDDTASLKTNKGAETEALISTELEKMQDASAVGTEVVNASEVDCNKMKNEAIDARSLPNAGSDFKEETHDALIVAAHENKDLSELSPELMDDTASQKTSKDAETEAFISTELEKKPVIMELSSSSTVGSDAVNAVEVDYNKMENESVDAISLPNAGSDFKEETHDAINIAAHENKNLSELSPELMDDTASQNTSKGAETEVLISTELEKMQVLKFDLYMEVSSSSAVGAEAEAVNAVKIDCNKMEDEAVDARSLPNAESYFKEETHDTVVAAHENKEFSELSLEWIDDTAGHKTSKGADTEGLISTELERTQIRKVEDTAVSNVGPEAVKVDYNNTENEVFDASSHPNVIIAAQEDKELSELSPEWIDDTASHKTIQEADTEILIAKELEMQVFKADLDMEDSSDPAQEKEDLVGTTSTLTKAESLDTVSSTGYQSSLQSDESLKFSHHQENYWVLLLNNIGVSVSGKEILNLEQRELLTSRLRLLSANLMPSAAENLKENFKEPLCFDTSADNDETKKDNYYVKLWHNLKS